MKWLEKHIVEWIADNRFTPDEFPCMQVHVQLWNGMVLTAQHLREVLIAKITKTISAKIQSN